jgi:hypothetical protein
VAVGAFEELQEDEGDRVSLLRSNWVGKDRRLAPRAAATAIRVEGRIGGGGEAEQRVQRPGPILKREDRILWQQRKR